MIQNNFKKIEAFVLTEEMIPAFYPLLPEEHRKADIDEEFVILGAIGTDRDEVCHACGTMVLKVAREDILLLTWMLVAAKYQRQGAGYALMDLAQDIAKEMKMQVIGTFSQKAEEGKEGSIYRFLKNNDFTIYDEGAKSYSISIGKIGEEDFFKKSIRGSEYMTLEETPSGMIMDLNRELAEKGLLLIGPISKDENLAEVSLVSVENGRIHTCVIFRAIDETAVELAFVYTGSKASMQMPLLLMQAYQTLKEHYLPETELVIPCVTEASCKLVETLLPSAKETMVSYRVQWVPERDMV